MQPRHGGSRSTRGSRPASRPSRTSRSRTILHRPKPGPRKKEAEIVARFVEPGASATDDRRPEFQKMVDAATGPGLPFDTVVVHSMSRFFRDQYLCEMYLRKLAKAGIAVVSITQNFADDPTGQQIRKVVGIFDEYQSPENAKHTTRAMKENARQGFWNGSRPPLRLPRRGSDFPRQAVPDLECAPDPHRARLYRRDRFESAPCEDRPHKAGERMGRRLDPATC